MTDTIYHSLEGLQDEPKFRILTLHPADSPEDDIQCSLAEGLLTDPSPYEALSYTWGDASDPPIIYCNGHPLHVTRNLFTALHYLRYIEGDRVIWIDAICINQTDCDERTSQVGLMREIYKKAEGVVVWLGEEEDDSELVFPMCERLVAYRGDLLMDDETLAHKDEYLWGAGTAPIRQRLNEIKEAKAKMDSEDGEDNEGDEDNEDDENAEDNEDDEDEENDEEEDDMGPDHDPTRPEIDALIKVIQRPWFTRCWVLQELCLGRETEVICGNTSTTWAKLLAGFFIATLFDKSILRGRPEAIINRGILQIAQIWAPFYTRNHDTVHFDVPMGKLLGLLRDTLGFDATDARDKVYALLGLVSTEGEPLHIVPDYTISINECYHRTACAILAQEETLDLLMSDHKPRSRPDMEHLPSWVPDWSSRSQDSPTPLVFHEKGIGALFSACGTDGTSYKPILRDDDRTLVLSGFVIDTITAVADALPLNVPQSSAGAGESVSAIASWLGSVFVSTGGYFDTLVQWEKFAHNKAHSPSPTEEDPLHVFVATLCLGNMPDGAEARVVQYREWSRLLSGPRKLSHLRKLGARGSLYQGAVGMSATAASLIGRSRGSSQKGDAGPSIDRTFSTAMERTLNRRLARAKGGFLGIVPASTRVGDSVVLFRGGKVPFVVRKTDGDTAWELVGPAYVHGAMYGELWDEEKCAEMCIS